MTYEWPLYICLFLALWRAMQNIIRDVIRTQFVAGIISIAIFALVFALYSLAVFEGAALAALVLAAVVYCPTVFLVTVLGNVPMNNRLESLDQRSENARIYWEEYGRKWTRLNHYRSIGSVLTAGLYIIAAITLITSGQV